MVKHIVFICQGTRDDPHPPVELEIDKNSIDVYRMSSVEIRLTEGRDWKDLATELDVVTFEGDRCLSRDLIDLI